MLILLKAVDGCNLKCAYCSNGDDRSGETLGAKQAEALAEQLPGVLGEGEPVNVLWHGGEPTLLSPSLFEEIQSLFIERLEPKGHKVETSMQTNGFDISPEWLSCLCRFGVRAGVSLDGPPALHDVTRRTHDGQATYERVIHNVRSMTDAGISVSLLCVVQERHTRNVLDVVQWIKELGLSVRFNPLLARGRSGESLPPHAYFQFLRDAFTLCCEYSVGARVEPVSWMIENVIFGRPATECSFGGACGRSILAFFPDGGVGPCVRSKTRYGNIHDKETSLSEMWRGRARSELLGRGERLEKFCGGCRARMGCNGGCPAVNGDSPSAGDCAERRDFFGWLSQEGVALLQGTLVKEKSRLKEKAAILQKARKTLAGGRDV